MSRVSRIALAAAAAAVTVAACGPDRVPVPGEAVPIEDVLGEDLAGPADRQPAVDGVIVEDPDTEVQRLSHLVGDGQLAEAGTVQLDIDGTLARFELAVDTTTRWLEIDGADVRGKVAVVSIAGDLEVMMFAPDAIATSTEPHVALIDSVTDPALLMRDYGESSDDYSVGFVERTTTAAEEPLMYIRLEDLDDEVPLFYVRGYDDPDTAAALFVEPAPTGSDRGSHVWIAQVDGRWIGLIAGVDDNDVDILDDAMRSLRPGR